MVSPHFLQSVGERGPCQKLEPLFSGFRQSHKGSGFQHAVAAVPWSLAGRAEVAATATAAAAAAVCPQETRPVRFTSRILEDQRFSAAPPLV